MAKGTVIVSKNIFQNKHEEERVLIFKRKWLEIISRLDKNSYWVQSNVQAISDEA